MENRFLWRIIQPFGGGFGGGLLPLAVDLAENIPFGGGSKDSLPTVGGKDPLGSVSRLLSPLLTLIKSGERFPDVIRVKVKSYLYAY